MTRKLYTLKVFILQGLVPNKFVKTNPASPSRTIEILGLQTLADLHEAIFQAYDRWDDSHLYEFQFGRRPYDPDGDRYGLHFPDERPSDLPNVAKTSLDSLCLAVGQAFGYRFDFGDEWYHQINVVAIGEAEPKVKYPRVIARVGESPPQYMDEDEDGDECEALPSGPPDDLQDRQKPRPPRQQRRGPDTQSALQFDDE